MSFGRPRRKLPASTPSRGAAPDPDHLLNENLKLNSEIADLEKALQLHHDLNVEEDNTIQGMLRKEIGGTRWQHGGSGKLQGYKSTSDLKEPHGLTPVTADQRRRRAREQNKGQGQYGRHRRPEDVSRPSPCIQDDSTSADEDLSKYPDQRNKRYIPGYKKTRKARSSAKTKDSKVMMTSTSENNIQGELFPTDPMHIEDLKHKVLERIGAGVIKRPSRHSSKSDNNVIPESHSKHESSSVKPSQHKSKLQSKQTSQGNSELTDRKNSVGLQSKHSSTTKSPMVKDRNGVIQENVLVSENSNKQSCICPTEEVTAVHMSREMPTSDYSSDVELFPDKVEEGYPLTGFGSETDAFSHLHNKESNNTVGKNSSNNASEYLFFKGHKCLSDDADDTPVLGIKSLLPAKSTSHLSEKNIHRLSKEDNSVKTKELVKPDHAVEVWLRNIGLRNCDKYVEIFARHEIEMSGLKYLTAELLNQMGVTAVGPVNKILMAILNLEESEHIQTHSSRTNTHGSHTQSLGSHTQTLDSHANTHSSHIQTPDSHSQTSLTVGDSTNVVPQVSSANVNIKHSPMLSPKAEDCIPEFTSNLQTKMKNMNMQNREASTASELSHSDNVELRNRQPGDTYTIQSESRRPKSKTLMTKRSSSASRILPDNKAVNKPRVQSRSANVSAARQRDIVSGKKDGKKEKVTTSREKSMTSRSNVPNKVMTDVIHKKAEIGICVAAHKLENRQKQEQDEQNLQLKLMKKRKQKRDEMAAKHQDRKTDTKYEQENARSRTPPLNVLTITTPDTMSSQEEDDAPLKIVLTSKNNQDIAVDATRDVRTAGRPRPSTAMPRSERNLDELQSTEEKSLSARERLKHVDLTLQVFKSQTNIHQRLTLDMVKDLQKQLEEIEKEITNTDGNSETSSNLEQQKPDPMKSTHIDLLKLNTERRPATSGGTLQKDQTTRGSKNVGIGKKVDPLPRETQHTSGSGMTISRSKRALLDEIRKEKDEHRKQIRHLQSELIRLQHKDPVRKSELDAKDIIFNDKDIIGEGAFSQVFKGHFQGAEVAVKRLKVPLSSQDRNYFAAEVSLLRELHHPRIVMLIGVCTSHKLPLMVLEYLSKGNLFAILHDSSREMFDHAEYYQIARDIASGMVYLHNHRPSVLHLDLKSMNVLIGMGNRAKIADFGFSKLKLDADVKAAKADKGRQIQGSPAWMAPEMVQGGEVTVKTDVYSFAIILWEMLTRKIPYENCSTFQILEKVRLGKRPDIPADCPQELSDFIQKCWDSQPTRRPHFKEVLVSIENLSFPPDWRALFQQAGVPDEALENLQSTRNIISIVTSTLESSKLQKIIDRLPEADHVKSSTSVSDEGEQSTEESNKDRDEEEEKLSLDQMSDDSLEHFISETSLMSWPTPESSKLESQEDERISNSVFGSEQTKPVEMKFLQPPSDSVPHGKNSKLSPRMFESKKDACTSPRKSIEAWTVENGDKSSSDKTDARPVPPPPPPPPPLPPPSLLTGKQLKQENKVPLQAKSKATSQILKEKSLGLKKHASKSKDTKRNGAKSRRTGKASQDGCFVLEASELQKQRNQLRSTACPHPNQLEDLNTISKKDLYSIAEILKHAMSQRRFAMGEVHNSVDTDVSQSQAELSWSTQDD